MKSRPFARLFRFLRIASTLLFSALCIVVIVLWVRSYWYLEGGMISTFPNQHIAFHGGSGRLCVWLEHSRANQWFDWHYHPNIESVSPDDEDRIPVFDLAFFWPTMTRLYVAHWLLAVTAALMAIAPWCPRQFGLRAMLIGVTAISVTIALITWIDTTF